MITKMKDLLPGDVLLYPPKGIFGKIIAFKTWHKVGHVELYMGNDRSIASRDGKGADIYTARLDDVMYVLRPKAEFNREKALVWFCRELRGQPYGWLDLLQFGGFNINGKGIVCSPCVCLVLRAVDILVFGNEPAAKIAPCSFLLTELLTQIFPIIEKVIPVELPVEVVVVPSGL